MTKRVIFLFSFGSLHFFGYLKINIAACRHALCFYMTTVMLHRIIPPPLYSSLGKQQQQKNTFLFRSPSFILAPLVILLVTFNRFRNSCARRAPGGKCTNHQFTRSDRIFFVPIFNIFFCSGIITAHPSEVDGNGRAMDRGRPPPSISSCDFRTELLQRPKNQRS